MSLTYVIGQLEAAEAGSDPLDDSVVIAALDGEMMDWWDEAAQQHQIKAGDGSRVNVTPVTTSLDAALALAERVVGNREWMVEGKDRPLGRVYRAWLGIVGPVYASTPALALCIAILKAKCFAILKAKNNEVLS